MNCLSVRREKFAEVTIYNASVRPPSLDIPREKVLERPNFVPLNINHISEADVAACFYQQMQLQQAQNAVAAAAAMQAAMATSMNPSQSIPLMYQVPGTATAHES